MTGHFESHSQSRIENERQNYIFHWISKKEESVWLLNACPTHDGETFSIWEASDREAVFSNNVCLMNVFPVGGGRLGKGICRDLMGTSTEGGPGNQVPPLHHCLLSVGVCLANASPTGMLTEGREPFLWEQGYRNTLFYTPTGPGTLAFMFLGLLLGMEYLLTHYPSLYFGFSVLKKKWCSGSWGRQACAFSK